MSDPYVGEIQAFPFAFAVGGFNRCWVPCGGQMLSIQQYSPLFSLIGTYYGGNGSTTFALPNLLGAVAIGQGAGQGLSPRSIGDVVGSASVTLISQEMAAHTHRLQVGVGTTPGGAAGPAGLVAPAAIDPTFNGFVAPPGNVTLAPTAIAMAGGGGAHDNMQPNLAMVWCIALTGIFPAFP